MLAYHTTIHHSTIFDIHICIVILKQPQISERTQFFSISSISINLPPYPIKFHHFPPILHLTTFSYIFAISHPMFTPSPSPRPPLIPFKGKPPRRPCPGHGRREHRRPRPALRLAPAPRGAPRGLRRGAAERRGAGVLRATAAQRRRAPRQNHGFWGRIFNDFLRFLGLE